MTTTGTWDWKPYEGDKWVAENVGDNIAGKIVKIHAKDGRDGSYPVVTVQIDEEGHRKEIHASTDLARKLAAANVQVGDWLKAELVELKYTGQPSPMKVYTLKTKPGAAPLPPVDDSEPF